MLIHGQNAPFYKRPLRPIVGGTRGGRRPMLYNSYWRAGYGKPEVGSLPFWVQLAGEYHGKAGYSSDEHASGEGLIQLFYSIGGAGTCRYKGKLDQMAHGDLLIVPRYTDYQVRTQQGLQYHWVGLGGDWPPALLAREGLLSVGYDAQIETLLVELRETLVLRQAGFAQHSIGIVFQLMGRIEAVIGGTNSAESAYPSSVCDAISILRESYANPFDASKLASAVGLSSARLRVLFQAWIGESPHQFHTRHRIKQAQHLLTQRSMAIYEVAHRVGFTDAHYFSRVFKRVTGITPTQYRHMENRSRQGHATQS